MFCSSITIQRVEVTRGTDDIVTTPNRKIDAFNRLRRVCGRSSSRVWRIDELPSTWYMMQRFRVKVATTQKRIKRVLGGRNVFEYSDV